MKIEETEKLEIILAVMASHRKSIDYRRDLQFKAFSWVSTVYVAIMAGMITLIAKEKNVSKFIPILISFTSILLSVPYVFFLKQCKKSMNRNALNIVPIEKLLGLYDKGFYIEDKQVYSDKSMMWGCKIDASPETNFYVWAVIILAFLTVLLSWQI